MKKAVIIGITILVLLGVAVFMFQLFQADPLEVAQDFLQQIEKQRFVDLENLLAEPHPNGEEFARAFRDFGDAFGLVDVELATVKLLEKDGNEAIFSFELEYRSNDFEPLKAKSNLVLKRESFYKPWRVYWEDNLPLSQFGFAASYVRTRLEPIRGTIVDKNGSILAGEGSLVSVGVQPDRITDSVTLLQTLEDHLDLKSDYVKRQYEAPGVQGHWFVPLVNLTEQRYLEVEQFLRPVPGVFFRRVEVRAYQEKQNTAHITGYLGEVTTTLLESFPDRKYVSGEVVGRSGLEAGYDDHLRGRPGFRFFAELEDEPRVLLSEKATIHGRDLELTLDLKMQDLAYEILADRSGALVILNAESGAILALCSTPSYDPNLFTGGISIQEWEKLSTDPLKPMFNRALQGLYPPGSVFKVVTVAAALDQNLLNTDSLFLDSGELSVEGNIIRNFQRQVFHEHDLSDAIVDSINTTVARVGLDLGAPLLQEYFSRWGLDAVPKLGLPTVPGQLGTPGRSKVALAWSSLGQDQVLLTPLQIAQIFLVFANEGKLHLPYLVQTELLSESVVVLEEQTVNDINDMLKRVVHTGTARGMAVDGMEMFAKTGTAEILGGGMHAWFAGHAQLPSGLKIAFALLVEEGGVGGQVAAPLMKEYFSRLIQ